MDNWPAKDFSNPSYNLVYIKGVNEADEMLISAE